MFRDSIDERQDIFVRGEGAGRVVRVGNKNNAGIWRDGLSHSWQIVAVILGRYCDAICSIEVGYDRVNGKAVLGDHNIRAGAEEGVRDEFDDLVGAVAEDQLVGVHGKPFGHGVA